MASHEKFDELAPMKSLPSVVGNLPVVDLGSSFEPDPGEVVHEDEVDHDSTPTPDLDTPTPCIPAALTRPTRVVQQPQRYGEPIAHVACFAFITIPRNYRE